MGFSWNSLLLVLLVSSGLLGAARGLVVKCPTPGSSGKSYCSCSPTEARIRCDFQKKEHVMLTMDLLAPYDNMSLNAVSVLVKNAASVHVRSDFMERWLKVPSSALDIWNSGTITLHPTPSAGNIQKGTFAGVGFLNCHIPELPTSFLRDRMRGAIRIKQSKVGVIRTGFLDNVRQMRYIVLEDSVVEEVEGSVAAEGYVTLSKLQHVHSWDGLVLSNVTIGTLGRGAFNLTHKSDTTPWSDMEVMSVSNCRVEQMGAGALSATGDIQVIIKGNILRNLGKGAFKANVTGSVTFNGNLMEAENFNALGDLGCHNASSIQNNTILVSTHVRPVPGQSSTPFHASCGKPQLFMVLTPALQILVVEDMRAAWVLVATLVVLGMMMVVGVAWSFRSRRPILSIGRFPDILNGRRYGASLENLPRNMELNISPEDPEEGTSVKDLDITCEPHQDGEQPLLGVLSDAQSVKSCEDAPLSASDGQHFSSNLLGEDVS